MESLPSSEKLFVTRLFFLNFVFDKNINHQNHSPRQVTEYKTILAVFFIQIILDPNSEDDTAKFKRMTENDQIGRYPDIT